MNSALELSVGLMPAIPCLCITNVADARFRRRNRHLLVRKDRSPLHSRPFECTAKSRTSLIAFEVEAEAFVWAEAFRGDKVAKPSASG